MSTRWKTNALDLEQFNHQFLQSGDKQLSLDRPSCFIEYENCIHGFYMVIGLKVLENKIIVIPISECLHFLKFLFILIWLNMPVLDLGDVECGMSAMRLIKILSLERTLFIFICKVMVWLSRPPTYPQTRTLMKSLAK